MCAGRRAVRSARPTTTASEPKTDGGEVMSGYQCISVNEAENMIRELDVLVLDMRDSSFYNRGHFPNALHLDDNNLRMLLKHTAKDVPILIYCYHGHSSQDMARLFADFGFKNCFSLDGGYEAWFQTVTPPRQSLSEGLEQWLRDRNFDPANLDWRIGNNETALMVAAREGLAGFCEELLAAGASLDLVNSDNNNALWMACESDAVAVAALLIEQGIDLNNQNDNGATALIYAASLGRNEMVRLLIGAGANPVLKTLDDFTALDVANNPGVSRMLHSLTAPAVRVGNL
ncbi:MAG: hypothetical protein EP334_06065 [Gammaproteobacteria bacterium]|nr:MAG: hypothetical protein EP334_06065 [Gammaproteobacteria bacterium]